MMDARPQQLSGLPPVVQAHLLRDSGRIVHAFSTRLGGVSQPPFATLNLGGSIGDDLEAVRENRRRFFGVFGIQPPQVVRVRQVHGNAVLVVDAGLVRRAEFPTCLVDERVGRDALITDMPDLALVISTADCLPVLIQDPVHRVVAAVHAGWRGTTKRISARAVEAMAKAYGTHPAECRAAIGPGVRACCYEVDARVREAALAAGFVWEQHTVAARTDHWRLDLAGMNRAALEAAGVPAGQIEDIGLCTACRTDLFFSHRAEKGRTGRMMNFILKKAER
jgi:YfiH family protein